MTTDFDPYHRWLGIPPKHQPPDFYRLLGLSAFERDTEVISYAAERQIRHVRSYELGPNREVARKLLNELGRARATLLDEAQRAEYDQQLRAQSGQQKRPAGPSPSATGDSGPKLPVAARLPTGSDGGSREARHPPQTVSAPGGRGTVPDRQGHGAPGRPDPASPSSSPGEKKSTATGRPDGEQLPVIAVDAPTQMSHGKHASREPARGHGAAGDRARKSKSKANQNRLLVILGGVAGLVLVVIIGWAVVAASHRGDASVAGGDSKDGVLPSVAATGNRDDSNDKAGGEVTIDADSSDNTSSVTASAAGPSASSWDSARRAVVRVEVLTAEGHTEIGTGFIIDGHGRVATAYGLIEHGQGASVIAKEGRYRVEGTVAVAPECDLAILQMEIPAGYVLKYVLPLHATLGTVEKQTAYELNDFFDSQQAAAQCTAQRSMPVSELPSPLMAFLPESARENNRLNLVEIGGQVSEQSCGGPLLDAEFRVMGVVVPLGQSNGCAIHVRHLAALYETASGLVQPLARDPRAPIASPPPDSATLPEVLDARRLCVCRGPVEGLRSVAFLPERNLMLSASNDDALRLWDLASGREIHCFRDHTSNVTDAAFLDDGKRAVSSSDDHSLILWDLEEGRPIRQMKGHRGAVISLAVGPHGQRVVASGHDRTARIWDLATGKQVGQLQGHTWSIEDVAWSPDGRYILTGGGDHRMCCWEAESGNRLWEHKPGYNWIRLGFSRDGKYAFSHKKCLDVWDAADGRLVRRFETGGKAVATVEFLTQQNRVLAATNDGSLHVWDLDTGAVQAVGNIEGKFVRQASAGRDGILLAAVSADKAIHVWKVTVRPPPPDT